MLPWLCLVAKPSFTNLLFLKHIQHGAILAGPYQIIYLLQGHYHCKITPIKLMIYANNYKFNSGVYQ